MKLVFLDSACLIHYLRAQLKLGATGTHGIQVATMAINAHGCHDLEGVVSVEGDVLEGWGLLEGFEHATSYKEQPFPPLGTSRLMSIR